MLTAGSSVAAGRAVTARPGAEGSRCQCEHHRKAQKGRGEFLHFFLQTEIEIESHGDDRQRSWADRNFLNQKDADAQVQAGLRRLPAYGLQSE
jgi:hypothetical protein